jgi:hypothetical protein
MIISHIIGGLGNQMFQYALGRSRSLALGVPVKLHVSDFADYGLHHGFELNRIFSGSFVPASDAEVRAVLGWRRFWLCRRILTNRRVAVFRGPKLVVEPYFGHWSGISETTDNCYLVGNWQSEKYFRDIEGTIRADFVFRKPPNDPNQEWIARIRSCQAVSLHVRRGDYATSSKTLAVLGLLPLGYYHSAVEFAANRIDSPEFFVFSDDIPWAREHLNIAYPCHFIDDNKGPESYNDMRLMSLCRHHIIANSSFSWWGAWLNPRADKLVVAPRRWFANDWNSKDLIPERWVAL